MKGKKKEKNKKLKVGYFILEFLWEGYFREELKIYSFVGGDMLNKHFHPNKSIISSY